MIQGDARNIHFPLSVNKGVNQQVMRFTPFIVPKKFLGIFCMVYCGTMSGILFLRIIQSY